MIRDHVLLALADDLAAADAMLAPRVTRGLIGEVLDAVPDTLLLAPTEKPEFPSADAARARYASYLLGRLEARRTFLDEALSARATLLASPPLRLPARR
jgi:hypothetical protein